MGYEVVYFYHERLPSGKWNMDERLEMKRKVGNPIDDVELEKLAAIIIGQLAKRDKLVVDVEVYEYSKRKINYKEATDGTGIVLKNKKFSTATVGGELIEEELADQETEDSGRSKAGRNLAPLPRNEDAGRASNRGRVRTWMLFDPELPLLHEAKKNGLHFTVNKKYPVYEIETHPTGVGQVLTVVDDLGKQLLVSDKYFVAATQVRLVGDNEVQGGFGSLSKNEGPRLSYEGDINIDMPDLRPGARRM